MRSVEFALRWVDRAHRQVPIAIAAILILAGLLLATSWTAFNAHDNLRRQQAWQVHTLDVLLATNQTRIAALQIMRGERGYVLTGEDEYLQPFHDGNRDMTAALDRLEQLVRNNPEQSARLVALRDSTETFAAIAGKVVQERRSGRVDAAVQIIRSGDGRREFLSLSGTLDAIAATEQRLLALRNTATDKAAQIQNTALSALALVGIAMIAFTILAIGALRKSFAREAQYRAELRRWATTDELTSLANRREIISGLKRAIAAAQREARPLSLATIDIDHFKSINDTYGHPAGDAVIREVARIAVATVRGCDQVGRLGGEEFAIVLPGANVEEARIVCERLRRRIHAHGTVMASGETIRVSISTGVAGMRADETIDSMVLRADAALYEAKRSGRDRVRLAA